MALKLLTLIEFFLNDCHYGQVLNPRKCQRANRFFSEPLVIFLIDVGYVSFMLIRTAVTESFDSQNMDTNFRRLRLRNMNSILI